MPQKGAEARFQAATGAGAQPACSPQFGVCIVVLLPLGEVYPNELPRGPSEGGSEREAGKRPTVPRFRAARPLPPVSVAAETSCSIPEAQLRDVRGVGVAWSP